MVPTRILAPPQAGRYGYGPAVLPPATLFRPTSTSLGRRPTVVRVIQARQGAPQAQNLRSQPGPEAAKSVETVTIPTDYSPLVVRESPNYIGSPMLWIGVGVGISVLFSWAAGYAKKQVMQQAFKSMMGPQGANPFGSMPVVPGQSPFPFPAVQKPPKQAPIPSTSVETSKTSSKTAVIDMESENHRPVVEADAVVETSEVKETTSSTGSQSEQKVAEEPSVYFKDPEVRDSGSTFEWNTGGTTSSSTSSDGKSRYFSVETLEKMLEDPTVQQMVYPYLPEEMRNPSTFKWMMQNPQFRMQLQEMLNGMTDENAWNSGQMADILKNFNPNNQELKQQFEQIGLTPEEVMAKMVANPDIALAFQNPKIQAALIDCSQNPANIQKYQNDKEIMDVFNKIAELFPIKGF